MRLRLAAPRVTKQSSLRLEVVMRALLLKEYGGPEKLSLADVDRPEPAAGQLLVKIAAASVNPIDLKIREGLPIGPAMPAILGCDFAGTIAAIGSGVTGFRIGEAVGSGWLERRDGAWLQVSEGGPGHFVCRKPRLATVAALAVEPKGYSDRGNFKM